jgi:hypothetical protein
MPGGGRLQEWVTSMTDGMPISFGDNVRVRKTPATQIAGVVGLIGNVRGETTPSVTNVDVIGGSNEDYALNVYFEDRSEAFWFARDQLDFLDHAAGTEITLDGVGKRWVRNEAGGWDEFPTGKTRKSFWDMITWHLFGRK